MNNRTPYVSLREALEIAAASAGDVRSAKRELHAAIMNGDIELFARCTVVWKNGGKERETTTQIDPTLWEQVTPDWNASSAEWSKGKILRRLRGGERPNGDYELQDIYARRKEVADIFESLRPKVGRPPQRGYMDGDDLLVEEMRALLDGSKSKSVTSAAIEVIGPDGSRAAGGGTFEAKRDRLRKRYLSRYPQRR